MDNSNILLQIEGVKGSSTLADYNDHIECHSWSFNVAQPTSNSKSGAERTAANPMFSDISISKETDISSTELFRLCATAKEIPKVTLTILRKADEENKPMIKIEMEKVIISNYSISGGSDPRPLDTFSLNYVKIKMEYHHQNNEAKIAGKTDFGYDLSTNKKA
jgi:type VI secretion system secreted protein Hcp